MDQILAIKTFVRVAEAGSFAKAADTMNLPRSSVSKLVQDLEAHLGTKLVERTTRSVTMTTEGVAYHERALKLLADLDDMDGTVAGSRSAPKGKLRVDIGSVLANQILIPRSPIFRASIPISISCSASAIAPPTSSVRGSIASFAADRLVTRR